MKQKKKGVNGRLWIVNHRELTESTFLPMRVVSCSNLLYLLSLNASVYQSSNIGTCMKNVEKLLQDLLTEHDFLRDMQGKIVDNYDILAQNQRQNADRHEVVVQNQSKIIKNQEVIVGNQISIIRNQRQIVQNQVTLDVMLKTQALALNLLRKLTGQPESLSQTEESVEHLKNISKETLRFDSFNNAESL